MRPGKRLVSVCRWICVILFVLPALAACSTEENCPQDGKWTTGKTSGVISFTTSYCAVTELVVSFDIGNGTTTTQIFEPSCTLSGSSMKCEQSGMVFKASFNEDGTANGSVVIPKGLELNTGGSLEQSVSAKWTASLKQ